MGPRQFHPETTQAETYASEPRRPRRPLAHWVIAIAAGCWALGSGCGDDRRARAPNAGPPDASAPDSGTPDATGVEDEKFPVIPGAAAELAAALVAAPDNAAATQLVEQVLAKLGVDVVDVAGVALKPPSEESQYRGAPLQPLQVMNLAVQARKRATVSVVTLEELGTLLQGLGLERSPNASAGDALVAGIAAWVKAGLDAPDDPESFPALFLAAMAQKQDPPVNLASGLARPEAVRLGLLDLEVLMTGLTRALRSAVPPGSEGGPGDANSGPDSGAGDGGGTTDAGTEPDVFAAAPATDCSSLKESFGVLGVLGGIGVGELSGKAQNLMIKATLEKLGVAQIEQTAQLLGRVLDYFKTGLKIYRLMLFYTNADIEITSDTPMIPVHRPATDDPDRFVKYTARVKVATDEYEKAKRLSDSVHANLVLKDCLDQLGLPVLPDTAQLAAEADTWRAAWSMPQGGGVHAYWDPAHRWTSKTFEDLLTRESPTTVTDQVSVQLIDEAGPGHRGPQAADGKLTVTAAINASKPPSYETFLTAAGALGFAIADIAMGWLQNAVQPKASLTLPVSYHYPYKGWRGYIRATLTAPEGETYYKEHDACGSRDIEYLHKLEKVIEWRVDGSESAPGGNLPGYPFIAVGDLLHGSGMITCHVHHTDSKRTRDCSTGKTKQEELNTTYAYSTVRLTDPIQRTPISSGVMPSAQMLVFNHPFGGEAPKAPTEYQFPTFTDFPCHTDAAFLKGTKTTFEMKVDSLLNPGQLTKTKEEAVLLTIDVPTFTPVVGTWNPADPDHVSGRKEFSGKAHTRLTTVDTKLVVEWELRRHQ